MGLETKSVQFFFLQVPTLKICFSNIRGSSGGGRYRFYNMLVHVCVTTKCGAHDNSNPRVCRSEYRNENTFERLVFGNRWKS